MGRAFTAVACAAIATMLSGCMEHVSPRYARSLKDDAPKPQVTLIDVPRTEAPRPEVNVIERAKAEQSARCGQRHVEYGKGTLQETPEEKGVADAICVELHKYDYVR